MLPSVLLASKVTSEIIKFYLQNILSVPIVIYVKKENILYIMYSVKYHIDEISLVRKLPVL